MSRFVVLMLVGCSFGGSAPAPADGVAASPDATASTEAPAAAATASTEAPAAAAVPAPDAAFPDAPPLVVSAWIRGEAVDLTAHEGLVLVEQWATWCGPCRRQIPHLTALQAEHGDVLTVVGVSDEAAETVRRFVSRQGDAMAYTVALTTPEANGRWFDFAENDGIPYAFLVHRGKVLWHGNPEGVDPILEAVRAGRWTPAQAEEVREIAALAGGYVDAAVRGDDGLADIGARLAESAWLTASDRNDLAWAILTDVPEERRDLDLALALATKACEATGRSHWGYEDTLALAQFQKGQVEEAVATQEAAVRLCEADGGGAACEELKERLASFSAG